MRRGQGFRLRFHLRPPVRDYSVRRACNSLIATGLPSPIRERLARETNGEVVATVGRIAVSPGATNVIPANVVITFDVRSGSDIARAKFADALKSGVREIADHRHLGLTITSTREVSTTPCHP